MCSASGGGSGLNFSNRIIGDGFIQYPLGSASHFSLLLLFSILFCINLFKEYDWWLVHVIIRVRVEWERNFEELAVLYEHCFSEAC